MAEEARRATTGKTKSNGPILVELGKVRTGNRIRLLFDGTMPYQYIHTYTQAPYVILAVYGTDRWGVARPLKRRSGPLADGSFNGIEVKLPWLMPFAPLHKKEPVAIWSSLKDTKDRVWIHCVYNTIMYWLIEHSLLRTDRNAHIPLGYR